MNGSRAVQRVLVTVGDRHTASMVGAHLLGEIADRTGLSSGYSAAVPWTGERAPGQDRGRLFAQVAVMLAAGGRSVADMAALRDQPELFGDVASPVTIWRAVHRVDEPLVVGGVRCHGGFLHDGTYVSPRTKVRAPAIVSDPVAVTKLGVS